jgi:3-deoxy-D-manno-octulosonic acid kinase
MAMDNGRAPMTNDSRDTGTAPSRAVPDGFFLGAMGDATLLVRTEYERSRPLSEILTGKVEPARPGSAVLSGGRGSASVHDVAGIGSVVLRRYRRGGLIGRVLVDRYLSSSRPFRELDVLARADALGVPVPEVVGASSIRAGLVWHRGRIVTRQIADSVTLPVFIEENRDDRRRLAEVLKSAGTAIRKMHEAGIDHADLNMNNILVDKRGSAFIIDFDKATARQRLGANRRLRNLRRLLRSLRKLKSAGRQLNGEDFSMIIRGYAGDDPALLAVIEKRTLRSHLLFFRSAIRSIFTWN